MQIGYRKKKILVTNVWSSELAKLASNAMLAQRISSINSLSALCEKTGANIDELSKAIGMDHRIGPKFLKSSVGFGGSCFQKDILNLVYLCQYYGLNEVAEYWHQVVKINDYQKNRFTHKIINYFNESKLKKRITILGWAFKANTNDSRESPSIAVVKNLLINNFHVEIYDPLITIEQIKNDIETYEPISSDLRSKISNNLITHSSLNSAMMNSKVVAILTDWEQFGDFNWKHFLKYNILFDGRNLFTELTGSNNYYNLNI